MAQLDKTFPTNDCAMCTISPKLVETGRHLNIDVLVDTEVLKVDGQAGRLHRHPAPQAALHRPDQMRRLRRLRRGLPGGPPRPVQRGPGPAPRRPQALPAGHPQRLRHREARHLPCRDACPAGQRAQGYIALIREGRYDDALRVIKEDNPFPGICGRICNHRCEDACNRGLVDEPVNIRALKRFVTDKVYAEAAPAAAAGRAPSTTSGWRSSAPARAG